MPTVYSSFSESLFEYTKGLGDGNYSKITRRSKFCNRIICNSLEIYKTEIERSIDVGL